MSDVVQALRQAATDLGVAMTVLRKIEDGSEAVPIHVRVDDARRAHDRAMNALRAHDAALSEDRR